MALTMTRTRTQTALTKLAELVADIHGELATVEQMMSDWPAYRDVLASRKQKLLGDRDALYITLKQFDPELEPTRIERSDRWLLAYGRRGARVALRRYLQHLSDTK